MEARLFFISLWWGLYGRILRKFSTHPTIKNKYVVAVFNGLFWATVGVILGMLRESYFSGTELNGVYAIRYAIVAGAIGSVVGFIKSKKEDKREDLINDNLEWADTCFSAILLASLVMYFIIQAFKIPSGSMRMTFVEGDHLFVNKFRYGFSVPLTGKKIFPFHQVERGDIVIFGFPATDKSHPHYGKDFIKRVVALEGQKVQIINKELFVDDEKVEEPYKQHVDPRIIRHTYELDQTSFEGHWEHSLEEGFEDSTVRDNFGPITVPEDHVMVLGDNRDKSYDSRFWGPLPMSAIKGRALLLYWPVKRFRVVHTSEPT